MNPNNGQEVSINMGYVLSIIIKSELEALPASHNLGRFAWAGTMYVRELGPYFSSTFIWGAL